MQWPFGVGGRRVDRRKGTSADDGGGGVRSPGVAVPQVVDDSIQDVRDRPHSTSRNALNGAERQEGGAEMAEIILIHGIAQEQREPSELAAEWIPALAAGVQKAGFQELEAKIRRREVSIAVAYYGDLFRQRAAQGAADDEAFEELLSVEMMEWVDRLGRVWLERGATRSSDEGVRRDAVQALGALQRGTGTAMGRRSIAREVVAALAHVRWFARPSFAVIERTVRRALRQVSLYMGNIGGTRDLALQRVGAMIDPSTRVVIGHSLGSVLAYEAAHRLAGRLALLLTLGSPLGLDTIVYERLVPQPPSYPPGVGRWVNLADLDDLIAADPSLASRFLPPPAGRLESMLVRNTSPHAATDYLATPEAGRPIGETFAAGGRG